jgi:hypothetical protein
LAGTPACLFFGLCFLPALLPMRFSMMPAAMHKIQGMRDFMTTNKQSGSPRVDPSQASALPRSATPAIGSHAVLQPPAQIMSSRQDAAARAMLSLPKTGSRSHAEKKLHQPGTQIPPPQPPQATMRTRTASETGLNRDRSKQDYVFDNSAVGSMFGDTVSLSASDGYRGTRHDRHYSVNNGQYAPEYQLAAHQREENRPFVFTSNGEMKEVRHQPSRSKVQAADLPREIFKHEEADVQEPYYHAHGLEDSPSKRAALKHSKLPHRDARDARRQSYADREVTKPPAQQSQKQTKMRPGYEEEQSDCGLSHLLEDFADHGANNRETVFHDINTPIMDEPSQWQTDAAEADMTEQLPATQDMPTPRGRLPTVAPVQKKPSGGSASLRRTGSNRLENMPSSRKRPLTPDYDDHQLNEMGRADLCGEAFDFDPKTAALRAVADENALNGADIETRLKHFRDKDSIAQHQFFRQMSVQDWEACGDWFLDQFTAALKDVKEARKAKRRLVDDFEAEIWTREDAVRAKTEQIGRTLQKFKQDGQSLMEGKDIDI